MEVLYQNILAPLPAHHLKVQELPDRALLSISTAHGQYSCLELLREPQEPCDHQLRVRGGMGPPKTTQGHASSEGARSSPDSQLLWEPKSLLHQ